MKREIVRLFLPLEMGAVGRILKAVAREYPDAQVTSGELGTTFGIVADDDVQLTKADRRRMVRERSEGS